VPSDDATAGGTCVAPACDACKPASCGCCEKLSVGTPFTAVSPCGGGSAGSQPIPAGASESGAAGDVTGSVGDVTGLCSAVALALPSCSGVVTK